MLFHFYPLSFISANNVATLTCNGIAVVNAKVFFDSVLPTVQKSTFTNFKIAKDFRLTLCAPNRQHSYYRCNLM
jgi:hypothetical protein